ncbi:MAG: hypothetical protein EAZ07_00785 [Cytophagales bacterium]|nr:MAG: hypothetical protein EAZ07_00785 [Cytophagales bacterium]
MENFNYKILIWVVVLVIYAIKQLRKLGNIKSTDQGVPIPIPKTYELPQKSENQKHINEKKIIEPKKSEESFSNPNKNKPSKDSGEFYKKRILEKSSHQKNQSKPYTAESSKSLELLDYDELIEDELSIAKKAQKELSEKALNQKKINPSLSDEHFDPYKLSNNKTNPIIEKLRNPETVREAIILSEILAKKY